MLVMIMSAMAWQAPLLGAAPVPAAVRPRFTSLARITSPTMMLTGDDHWLNTASSLLAGSVEAPSFNIMMAGACLLYAFARVFRATGVFQPASKAPSAKELAHNKKLSNFGWLQADLRMPLPSWEELETACHRIGTQEGQNVYLCAHESPGCQVSTDFTEHYCHPVYICDEA